MPASDPRGTQGGGADGSPWVVLAPEWLRYTPNVPGERRTGGARAATRESPRADTKGSRQRPRAGRTTAIRVVPREDSYCLHRRARNEGSR